MKDIPKNWSFDVAGVAEQFDAHVNEQLPWYPLVTRAVASIARHYVTPGGWVWDIGASTGNVSRAINAAIGRPARYVSVEASAAMAERWSGPGELLVEDACKIAWEEKEEIDFAVFFLVLMFVRPGERRELVRRVYSRLRPGGALVVVDRTVAGCAYPATVLWRLALSEKLAAGAPPAEIVEKELSLAGVQRPIDPGEMFDCTGAYHAVEFFRFGDFAGWLIERREWR